MYKLQYPVHLELCFVHLWTRFLMQERGDIESEGAGAVPRQVEVQQGVLLWQCLWGNLHPHWDDVCSVASLLCPDQPHTELQGCWELPELLSLFLWPLALFPSLCTSVQSSLAEILNMSCFPDVQGWLSSSLRAVNDAEEPASCWPWSTVPCCLPAPRDGPAQGAPVSLAAVGRAWDSVTAELGFPRLQEEFSASSQECGQVKS